MASDKLALSRPSSGVQSIARTFDLLELMADFGGIVGVSQLAARSGLPLPTIHRLIRTLVDLGYVRQQPSREYALGPRLVRLGEGASRLLGDWATPHLQALVDALGESANLAMLDDDQVVYTAQAQGSHSMRMFTEVGRRAWVHCTAVGKAMLADLPAERVRDMVRRSGMPAQTPRTITSMRALSHELARIREQGFAIDDEEQELGVRCIAVVLPGSPSRAAVSISGPSPRMSDRVLQSAIPMLTKTAASLATELDLTDAQGLRHRPSDATSPRSAR
jgi:IclR family transcriptional regulator, acetate operon repressor